MKNNSRNFTNFSEILLENFQSISRNIQKFYQKFFEMIFDVFSYNSQNCRKYSSKFSPIILKFSNFFFNIFKLFLKPFGNIYWYLPKFFKTFQNNFWYCINKQNKGMYSQPAIVYWCVLGMGTFGTVAYQWRHVL